MSDDINKNEKTDDTKQIIEVITTFYGPAIGLLETAIVAEKELATYSFQNQQAMLGIALKGAGDCPPENFSALLDAMKEIGIATLQAQKEVALASIENGKAAIKAMENVTLKSIEAAGLLGAADVASKQSLQEVRRADRKARELERANALDEEWVEFRADIENSVEGMKAQLKQMKKTA